jgi:single-strand DNA-binding protein
MNGNTYSIVGNMTADPELRFTATGNAVANFTIAHTPRVQKDDKWTDGDTLFMRCVAWGQMAENISESFGKGTRVVIVGSLAQNNWTDKHDQKRSDVRLNVEDIGASVRFNAANIHRPQRTSDVEREARAEGMTGDAVSASEALRK